MLSLAIVFLIATLVTAFFGFGEGLPASAGLAQNLSFLFLIGFVVSLVVHLANVRVSPETARSRTKY